MKLWLKMGLGLAGGLGGAACAIPTGLKTTPHDVIIPSINGKVLPVNLMPSELSETSIYVIPSQGVFINRGVVPSPLADCARVKGEMAIGTLNQKMRSAITRSLQIAHSEHQGNQEKYSRLVRDYETLLAQAEPLKEHLERLETESTEALNAVKTAKTDLDSLKIQKETESDKAKIAQIEAQSQKLERQLGDLKRESLRASKKLRQARDEYDSFATELATKKGKKNGIEKTLLVHTEEIQKIMDQLEKIDSAVEKELTRFSEREGGVTTITGDFAPSAYIAALKERNPKYEFTYVPSTTAHVVTTIPETVLPGSPLAGRVGSLIRGATWSDKEGGAQSRAFPSRLLTEKGVDGETSISLTQLRIPELQSSLVGTKFISIDLSVLGYCALREAESLSTEFKDGVADTFKLALHFTYPVNYALRVKGSFDAMDSLHEFHKITQSSSWFGLSQEQREEHVRRISSEKMIGVEVKPLGGDFSLAESMVLADKVKDQLLYFVAQPFLDVSSEPSAKVAPIALSADKVSARLMTIPNPWNFWAGTVLGTLSDLFTSMESSNTKGISLQKVVHLNYEAGFNMLHPVSLTIGDLTLAPKRDNQ